ncbi:class I SAM-dependent methyltransferase [Pseudonocardia alaniniphila]|uniref:Class I SAM-dependent methyltransferase n=1 Tax=Pseudonocardia alaniniphila TaxID=75291 RepID=A0ABS9T8V6_9PSEU|nr:class I SAM-dependent methyltransferase [Pseudonocardia alaniniphila]MCH6164949.1 class I SAM-dependent methyltransferase [Pseudonocardia alaniniphila]
MSPSKAVVPGRVRWALEVLDPGPAEHILEIGPGPGIAAGLVCDRLTTGTLLAVDRSAVATRRTAERNAAHVEAGRLRVRTLSLEELDVPAAGLDSAFSIDVNLFWTRVPTRELAILRAALRPGGALHLCYGSGGPRASERLCDPIEATMREHGFVDVAVRTSDEGLSISGRTPR